MLRRYAITLALALALQAKATYGFICEQASANGPCLHWESGTATMQSFFPPTVPLANGTLGWGQNAINAANDWNGAGAAFHFTVITASTINNPCGPQGPGHACTNTGPAGDNPVFFSGSVCGSGFGDIVAETLACWNVNTGAIINAPVFVNGPPGVTIDWDAYDGPLHAPVNDIRRVLVHEFGHVLGLDHNDAVVAIMNSRESDIDRLQADDINGVRSLYAGGGNSGGNSGTTPTNACQLLPGATAHAGWGLSVAVALVVALRRRARR